MIETCSEATDFVRSYFEAALWSSTDDAGHPLNKQYGIDDISPGLLASSIADCRQFLELAREPLECGRSRTSRWSDSELAGHDFWLTRNHHGAGFWDGDWQEGDKLTEISHTFGSVDLYVGDDGRIYG